MQKKRTRAEIQRDLDQIERDLESLDRHYGGMLPDERVVATGDLLARRKLLREEWDVAQE